MRRWLVGGGAALGFLLGFLNGAQVPLGTHSSIGMLGGSLVDGILLAIPFALAGALVAYVLFRRGQARSWLVALGRVRTQGR